MRRLPKMTQIHSDVNSRWRISEACGSKHQEALNNRRGRLQLTHSQPERWVYRPPNKGQTAPSHNTRLVAAWKMSLVVDPNCCPMTHLTRIPTLDKYWYWSATFPAADYSAHPPQTGITPVCKQSVVVITIPSSWLRDFCWFTLLYSICSNYASPVIIIFHPSYQDVCHKLTGICFTRLTTPFSWRPGVVVRWSV